MQLQASVSRPSRCETRPRRNRGRDPADDKNISQSSRTLRACCVPRANVGYYLVLNQFERSQLVEKIHPRTVFPFSSPAVAVTITQHPPPLRYSPFAIHLPRSTPSPWTSGVLPARGHLPRSTPSPWTSGARGAPSPWTSGVLPPGG